MRHAKIFVITILVSVLTVTGCGTKPTSNETAETQSTEATATVTSESQKEKEKAYYEAVKKGTIELTSAMGAMNSLMADYNSSKAQELGKSVANVAMKALSIAAIDPPPGYEHVQALYKQGSKSLSIAVLNITEGLDKNDSSKIEEGLKDMNQSSNTMVQGFDEMKSILTSHGISY